VLFAEFRHIVRQVAGSPQDIARQRKEPEEMTLGELRQQLALLQQAGARMKRALDELAVQLHLRFSVPFAAVAFALLGTPLGLRRQRTSSSLSLGLSVLIIFAYYVILNWSRLMGERGMLPPLPAAWLANAVTVIVGLLLLWRSPR